MVASATEEEDEFKVPETEEGVDGNSTTTTKDMMGESWEALEMSTSGWWRECIPSGEEHVLIWETLVLGQLHKGAGFFEFRI